MSLGGDGDSRLMKAMRISVGLFSKQIDSNLQEGLVSPLQTVSVFPQHGVLGSGCTDQLVLPTYKMLYT